MNYKLKFFLNSSDICGENSLYDRINALNSVVCSNAGIFQTGLAGFSLDLSESRAFSD